MYSDIECYREFFPDSIKNAFIFDSIWLSIHGREILKGVHLRVEKGSICGLFGVNGSGKSTLLKVGAGQLKPTEGVVRIKGKEFSKSALNKRFSMVAYVSQNPFLPIDLPVEKILNAFPLKTRKLLTKDPLLFRIKRFPVSSLSGGEKRYLELRLILSLEREFLLVDEPFTGIEPELIEKIMRLLVQYAKKGRGILITDHYYQYVLQIADYAYLMINKQCQFLADRGHLKEKLREGGYC